MKLPRPLSDEEAADFALSMSQLERDVIALCSKGKSWRYTGIAKKIGASYSDVQTVGQKLQAMRLAQISVVPFDGSAIFLNDRGESVKRAVEVLARIRAKLSAPSGLQDI